MKTLVGMVQRLQLDSTYMQYGPITNCGVRACGDAAVHYGTVLRVAFGMAKHKSPRKQTLSTSKVFNLKYISATSTTDPKGILIIFIPLKKLSTQLTNIGL